MKFMLGSRTLYIYWIQYVRYIVFGYRDEFDSVMFFLKGDMLVRISVVST